MMSAYLILVGWWINATVSQGVIQKTWLMTGNDSYRKYQCSTTPVGMFSPIFCSHLCCLQNRCIGMFFNELSSECLIINATEKSEPCSDLNWANWTPYRKNKGSIDTCSDYLMFSGNYAYRKMNWDGSTNGPTADLYYTPTTSDEVGGYTFVSGHTDDYIYVIFDDTMSVRGVATQGRWRNESFESCCDERVTAYRIHYSVDCMADWTFVWIDNYRIFEANVIPDAGNEVVENMFDAPVTGKCFAMYPVDFHVRNVIRWDLIGCGIVISP
ncbi:uncharacterized protein LOC123559215 isoform X2 [Mercenaria mercenaria]|nr:uncharacterized protein LOC123559215 isoform X2 [Mercenaria mercenaria]